MYSTVKELHIGIDIALQRINSASKQVIKPQEKDWVLNEVMFQLINNIIDPNPKLDRGYFEYSQRAMDMLETVKVNESPILPVLSNRRNSVLNAAFIDMPKDYFRMIKIKALINADKLTTHSTVNTYVIPFVDANTISDYTSDFTISLDTSTLFDVSDRAIVPKPIPEFNQNDSKFMFIPIILEILNSYKGISAKWVRFGDIYKSNSFIITIDSNICELPFNENSNIIFHLGNIDTSFAYTNTDTYDDYENGEIVSCRIIKSDDEDNINNHFFAKTKNTSPTITIGNNHVKFNIPDNVEIFGIIPEYYRKPKFINSVLDIGCEIQSIDFLNELVNQTAQKISARIDDKSYPVIVNENLLLS